jgi:hypothetical protein
LDLWDRFFLNESAIVEFGMAIAAAHLLEVRSELMVKQSFPDVLDYLHRIRNCDPASVIARAEDTWARYIAENR